ncbi:MAG: hypothetical protein R2706_12010 [Acidimicrobiales bacterium]
MTDEYAQAINNQVLAANEAKGPGRLEDLLRSGDLGGHGLAGAAETREVRLAFPG